MNPFVLIPVLILMLAASGLISRFRHQRVKGYRELKRQSSGHLTAIPAELVTSLKKKAS